MAMKIDPESIKQVTQKDLEDLGCSPSIAKVRVEQRDREQGDRPREQREKTATTSTTVGYTNLSSARRV